MTVYQYKTINVTLVPADYPHADVAVTLQRFDDPDWIDVDTYNVQIDICEDDATINTRARTFILEKAQRDAEMQEAQKDIPPTWEGYQFSVEAD